MNRSKWPTALALAGIAAVALWLRLHRLADHSLWVDEAFSVHFAHMHWRAFWKLAWSREANMLLYYLLLRPWVQFGDGEYWVRLLSAIFGVAGVLMMYALGRDLFSRATGLIASALLAVHAFHVYYSQEARSYSLTVFLLIGSAWLFARLVRKPASRRNQVAYALAAALAFYAHIFALLVIVSQWLAFLLSRAGSRDEERAEKPALRSLLPALSMFLLLALPMLAFALLKNKGQLDWIPPLTWHGFMQGLHAITGKGGGLLLALCLALAATAVLCGFRSRDPQRLFAVLLLAFWVLFPIVVFMLYSLHQPLFLPRYLVLCVPAAVLLAAEGVTTLAGFASPLRLIWIPALALLLALSARAAWRQHDSAVWPDWRSATRFVSAHWQGSDVLCFTGPGSEAFFYYWRQERQLDWDSLPATYYRNGTQCTMGFPEQLAKTSTP
ncbi:MAG TPA: glycosyltransferase family 39 protein, partial [Terriglobales bacterium]|nr:glycosyltransferase family 39 protein [Terriglobales bacterium]